MAKGFRTANKDQITEIELVDNGDGSVTVMTADGMWSLATFTEEGTIRLHSGLQDLAEFDTDKNGYLKVERD